MQNALDLNALHGFLDESTDSLQGIEADFIDLEKDPANLDIINRIFRPIHSLKGNSGFFGLTNINKFSHRLENLLDIIRKGDLLVSKEIIDTLLAGVDSLRQMLERVYADPSDVALGDAEEALLAKVEGFKPEKTEGTLESVLTLEKLLSEALDKGIDPHTNTLLSNTLSQIEKVNQEIKRLLEGLRHGDASADRAAATYRLNGADYTALLRPFIEVAECMGKKTVVAAKVRTATANALAALDELFRNNVAVNKETDELRSMANFFDDEMLVASDEFTSSTIRSIDAVLAAFDIERPAAAPETGGRLGEILVASNKVSAEAIAGALKKQKKVGEILVEEGLIDRDGLQEALAEQQKKAFSEHAQKQHAAPEVKKTIRIDQDKLDSFANFVGELFINIDSFSFLKKQLEEAEVDFDLMTRFTNTITSLDEMVDTLQESIMSIRKVPVHTLFQRFPRVIRQLAGSLEKEIDFRIRGDETVIDKDLLEKIENPLVHMLRNSVDHGIELPGERTAAGKPATGLLELKAAVDDNYVYLTIQDDGKGIDPEKTKAVAVKKGFLGQEEADRLSEKELINLIFKPGFSSAERVSDVSGRGVGMDVVLSVLRETNGTVEVESEVGRGTKLAIRIPLTKTLVAKEAMIVTANGRTLAIPSEDITATIEAKDDATTLFSGDSCIQYQGGIIQVVDLGGFLFGATSPQERQGSRQVITVCQKHKIALLVDEVLSHQKIVVKNFTDGYRRLQDARGINGYTILGNEDIILIADVQKIAGHAGQ